MNIQQYPEGFFYVPDAIDFKTVMAFLQWFRTDSVQDMLFHVPLPGESGLPKTRKVIHFGYKYDYLRATTSEPAPEMPGIIRQLRALVYRKFPALPSKYQFNQCVVNRYLPGQCIDAHFDHPDYGEYIACFSVGAETDVVFTRPGFTPYAQRVAPGSLFVMSGDSRHHWRHATHPCNELRISVSFRCLKERLNNKEFFRP
jgi:alkylated DNA repair dioxygenase AlkB